MPSPLTSQSTGLNPEGWLAWWREQSLHDGTDWRSLVGAAEAVLSRLRLAHGVSSS